MRKTLITTLVITTVAVGYVAASGAANAAGILQLVIIQNGAVGPTHGAPATQNQQQQSGQFQQQQTAPQSSDGDIDGRDFLTWQRQVGN